MVNRENLIGAFRIIDSLQVISLKYINQKDNSNLPFYISSFISGPSGRRLAQIVRPNRSVVL